MTKNQIYLRNLNKSTHRNLVSWLLIKCKEKKVKRSLTNENSNRLRYGLRREIKVTSETEDNGQLK